MANEINLENIQQIKDAVLGNHETLEALKSEDPKAAEQSFEQGYENGALFVCETLGIDLEDITSENESLADAWLRIHNKE